MRRIAIHRSSRAIAWPVSLVTLTLFGAGCGVPQDRYDQLLTSYRSAQERAVEAESERDEARADLAEAQSGVGAIRDENDDLKRRLQSMNEELDAMAAATQETMNRVAGMSMGPLPLEVEAALRDLAASRPDLLTFDAARGMVRFASDFTFDSGSDSLRPEAASAIGTIASVLNDSAASGLEIEVVGHTDAEPIGRPETRAKHPTNMHLSVHRAISVHRALQQAGIAPQRVKVAGRGEYLPVAQNDSRGKSSINRRVEIYITERQVATTVAMPEGRVPEVTDPPARREVDVPLK